MNYRIVHVSDIHVWGIPLNPLLWMGKRTLGLGNLVLRRGRKFRRHRLPDLVSAIDADHPDHWVISGDVSTTSLPAEFRMIQNAFGDRLIDSNRATVTPGNHDRYTRGSLRNREFDRVFGLTYDHRPFPFRKTLAPGLELIGFDPCVPRPLSARGLAAPADVQRLREILQQSREASLRCLLFVCHYPGEVPPEHRDHEKGHEMVGAQAVVEAFRGTPVPVYWLHGHLHHPWKYPSPTIPNLVYLNPGAPLLRRRGVVSFGRWILDWDGESLTTEWRSDPGAAAWLRVFP